MMTSKARRRSIDEFQEKIQVVYLDALYDSLQLKIFSVEIFPAHIQSPTNETER